MSRRRINRNDEDSVLYWMLFVLFLCLILSGCSMVREEKCIDNIVHFRWGNTQFWTMETDLGRPVRCAL